MTGPVSHACNGEAHHDSIGGGGGSNRLRKKSESRRFAASGAKASLVLHDLRGAKAPLYHSAAGFRDLFRSLLGYCPKSGREPGAPKPGEAMAPTPISPIPSLQYSRPPFVYTNG